MNDVNDETCSTKNASTNRDKEIIDIHDAIDILAWNKMIVGKMNQDKCKCTHSTILELIMFAEFMNMQKIVSTKSIIILRN